MQLDVNKQKIWSGKGVKKGALVCFHCMILAYLLGSDKVVIISNQQ